MRGLRLDPALRERRTASDYVADGLREAIINGELEDGEELNQVELAQAFNVSRVPIREAIRRLQAEGLVSSEAHRRVTVMGVTTDRLAEMFEIRAMLEGYMLEKGAKRMDDEAIEHLRALCDRMEHARNHDTWLDRNEEFHRTLISYANTVTALGIHEELSGKAKRYLRRGRGIHRAGVADPEHRAIVDALADGKVSKARKLLEEHIRRSGEEIVGQLREAG